MKNHAGHIWSCDFTVAHDLLFRPLYIFVVIELHTRRIELMAVTRSPTDDWTAQQLREATPWGKGPKYPVCDRDNKYGPLFLKVARSAGIQVLRTPVRSPKANAICERFIGSLKRECLDHMFILDSYQLHRIVRAYVDYYNLSRPHQGIGQRVPAQFPPDPFQVIRTNHRYTGVGWSTRCRFPCRLSALTFELGQLQVQAIDDL